MRRTGWATLATGIGLYTAVRFVRRFGLDERLGGVAIDPVAFTLVSVVAVLLGFYGAYLLITDYVVRHIASKRRRHNARNLLRLAFGAVALAASFGVITQNWVSVLFSVGVLGFAITFAMQQPLFSLIGWAYIMVKRPYQVGDRVAIEGTRGDVVSIDFLVTRVWEIDGELVSSNQPSGRTVTVPNSVVLSSHVVNYYGEGVSHVWNELAVQVALETDLGFAVEVMTDVADRHLGDRMAEQIETYRERLAETAVELDVSDRPTVNVVQRESWLELRLRYLVHPRRGTAVRNAMYEEILEAFNDHPERVQFPVGRNR